jgi:hypothetical protein
MSKRKSSDLETEETQIEKKARTFESEGEKYSSFTSSFTWFNVEKYFASNFFYLVLN